MALESHDTLSRPLLPAAIEARMAGLCARALGLVLIAVSAVAWAALIAWQRPVGAEAEAARTLLAQPGAWLGDLMLTSLGAAAVACGIAPLMWGLELVAGERIVRARSKVALLPLAVLALAGGLAALPTPSIWPIQSGLGGNAGGIVFTLAVHALPQSLARDGGWLAGLVLVVTGAAGFTYALGLSVADIAPRRPRRARGSSGDGDIDIATEPPSLGHVRTPPGASPRQRVEPARFDPPQMPERPATSRAWGPYAPPAPEPWLADAGDAQTPIVIGPDTPFAAPRILQRTSQLDDLPAFEDEAQRHGDLAPDADPLEFYAGDRTDAADEVAAGRDLASRLVRQPPDQESHPLGAALAGLGSALARSRTGSTYRRPSIHLLRRPLTPPMADPTRQAMLRGTGRLLQQALSDYGVPGAIRAMRSGPVVGTFEFEPQAGIKPARVEALADDIGRALGTPAPRVFALPGRSLIAVEIAHPERSEITLREILESEPYRQPGLTLPIAVGRTAHGDPVVLDLARLPAVLAAGSPQTPPVPVLHTVLLSLLYRHGPDTLRLALIDPGLATLSPYLGIPHLALPIVTEAEKGIAALDWAVELMDERAKMMAQIGARSLALFNNRVRNARKRGERPGRTVETGFDPATGRARYEQDTLDTEPLAHLVLMIADVAALKARSPAAVDATLARLARNGPAVGIHVLALTDRVTPDIVSADLKAALAARLCFKLASRADSGLVLDAAGAESLLAEGDMLVHDGQGALVRVHAATATSEDVHAFTTALRENNSAAEPAELPERPIPVASAGEPTNLAAPGSADELYECAIAVAVRARSLSPSLLAHRLRIDPHHARALVDRMRREGLMGERL